MLHGWVSLHRKILDSPVFQNEKLFKTFAWCLLKASHKEHEQMVGKQKVKLLPGQFVYGRKAAARELGMPESTVRNNIDFLKKDGCLDIKTDSKFSVITVVNWGFYQSESSDVDSRKDSSEDTKRTAKGQQKDTNNNGNNDNNGNKKDIHADADSNPFLFYELNFGGSIPSMVQQDIIAWETELPTEMIIEAMSRSIKANKRSWNYVESILMSWHRNGIKTIEAAMAEQAEYERKKAVKGGAQHGGTRQGSGANPSKGGTSPFDGFKVPTKKRDFDPAEQDGLF
ncbi:DnaD domain protein [Brevibacillus sp. M2.1A]|uniref:DnaD domain-containing protein n=1 Tax=Brevibacillus sp. M2.1A TaxID=2738980 RepID=UPI00156AA950|nr:DnaD domain protein [Brevibacillus sp. M2.1A]MCC8435438.1 DnaD domain protein [Brevibacillus sp. M2.1A]